MAIVLGRGLYTHYKRSKNDFPFSTASTAMPPNYSEGENVFSTEKDEKSQPTVILSEATEDHSIAILPQYITTQPTTLIMRECFAPRRGGNFDIADTTTGEALFQVVRETHCCSRHRDILDARTGDVLLRLRREVASLPRSHYLEDPAANKVLELQGKLNVPFQGPKSEAAFLNALSGLKVELVMMGSCCNRNVEIVEKGSGRVVARAQREVIRVRHVCGGRTAYMVSIEAGVDMTVIVGMIMALDDRAC